MIRKFEIFCSLVALLLGFVLAVRNGENRVSPNERGCRNQDLRSGRSLSEGEAESDWFIVQRAFPHNDIPRTALPAMEAKMNELKARSVKTRSTYAAADWVLAGPSNVGGRITALQIDPDNPTIIYAAAASGGVWKSTDFGSTWFNVFNESFSIGSLALSPENSNVVYVGTGEANPSSVDTYPGNGLWRSTDGGGTWTNLGLSAVGHIGKIVINPLNPNTIFISALGLYRSQTPDRGIYRSTDRGSTWTNVLFVDDTTGAADIVMSPTDTTVLLASSWTYYRTLAYVDRGGPGSGLYRSSNGGVTWVKITAGYPHDDLNIGRASLAFAPSNASVVYALLANGGGYNWGGVYKSTDAGVTWTESFTNNSFSETQVWYNNMILVHPMNENIVWAGMTSMYQSTDGGTSFHFATINGAYHVDHHAMEYVPADPGTIVLGNDGGIYISTNGGLNWTKSLNLPITQYYAGTVSNLNPNRLLGGTQDNGSSQTRDGSDPWMFFFGGDGFYCLIDPTDSQYVYAESQYGGMAYSQDGGNSFANGTSGLDFSEWAGWETPIALDPQHPKTLYTGLESVYRTKNNMQSWTKISGNLTNHISSAYSTVSTIDVSPVDSNVIYAGTGDGKVWVTTNGGSLWLDISSGLPLHWVTRVVADPESSNVAFVTLSGFREYDSVAHVFRTNNFGATWTNIGSGLPDIPVNDLIVDPLNRSHLYIATDMNVLSTTDGGSNWIVLGSSLPAVTVHDLAFQPTSRELVAFTHGRSVYTIRVAGPNFAALSIALSPHWNLVSNPLQVQNDSVQVLFPATAGPAYAYVPGSGYVVQQSVVPGNGYWVHVPGSSPQVSSIYGNIISPESISVQEGWNLVGSFYTSIPRTAIVPVGTSIAATVFEYANGYTPADSLGPGKGYWIKVDHAGMLVLSTNAGTNKSPLISNTSLEHYNKLIIRDQAGNRQTLYFGRGADGLKESYYDLPPDPPGDLFDARFASNSLLALAEDHQNKMAPVRIRSSSGSVTIEWLLHQFDQPASLVIDDQLITLEQDGTIAADVNGHSFGLRFGSLPIKPIEFTLGQNYPNPFNPSTEIKYRIPKASRVTLNIYDLLGRDVAKLVDQWQPAGEYTTRWDGSASSSGVYFYTLVAKSENEVLWTRTRKLILVK